MSRHGKNMSVLEIRAREVTTRHEPLEMVDEQSFF